MTTKDKHKTIVKFLYNERTEHLFAFFPEIEEYKKGLFLSYAHLGQHSACHIDFANESRPATEDEYKDLKKELEGIGYNLTIQS